MPKVTQTNWWRNRDQTQVSVPLLLPQLHLEATTRTSIPPAVAEPSSLPAMGSAASRPAVAAAGTMRPASAMETRCSRVRPQGPNCENPVYGSRGPRTAASPSPPLIQSALRAPPSVNLPTRYRGFQRGPGPILYSHKAARAQHDGKS